MITISLCMIVKNEEKVLARCLDSIRDLMDEIIIVDTGSTDMTRQIAAGYTDKIYEFPWRDDFSEARNFAFSKACGEYIYSADADEVLSEENRKKFLLMKKTLLPEIEIVQMKYGNQLQNGTVYNYDEEYRPKLFRRLRTFRWEEPVHEMIRLEPVIYDSDIVVTHLPERNHAGRDLANFQKQILGGRQLSRRLYGMYARELFLAGEERDFLAAEAYFQAEVSSPDRSNDEITEGCCVAARAARLRKDAVTFFKYTSKVIAGDGCSEICCEMGHFYEELGDPEEAAIWYYNAVYETQPVLALRACGEEPLQGLIRCYGQLGLPEQAESYAKELEQQKQGILFRKH